MTTNKVKCPECGKVLKVHGDKSFVCCGSRWSIAENILVEKTPNQEYIESEIDLSDPTEVLPKRKKSPKVTKGVGELICPYCKGDVWSTDRVGVYYCDVCRKYLIEE